MNKAIMMYKILHGLVAVPSDHLQTSTSVIRGHNKRLVVPHTRTQILQSSFFPDTIRIWNNLPRDVINSDSLDSFRTAILKTLTY
jgi:hypothetical protein